MQDGVAKLAGIIPIHADCERGPGVSALHWAPIVPSLGRTDVGNNMRAGLCVERELGAALKFRCWQ
jgi:hypothetical protein